MSTDLDLPLVVLTGASGFVGSQALDYLLKQNYRILAPVRSVSRLSYQKARYANTPYAARIQYVEVPDQSIPSSFDNILTGAEAIIHNATIDPSTPTVAAEVPEKLIKPVVDMASAIFLAALDVPSIKRFVYVGSSVSVVNGEILDGKKFTEEDWSEVTVEDAVQAGGGVVAYCAAKTLAEKKIWELTEEKKPGFEVVVLNPPEIIGRSLHEVKEAKSLGGLGTTGLKSLIDGKEVTGINPASYGNFINVVNVAKALDAAISVPLKHTGKVHRYLIADGTYSSHAVIPALLKRYPQLKGRLPAPEPTKINEMERQRVFDTSKAKKELGLALDTAWEQTIVEEFFGDYLGERVGMELVVTLLVWIDFLSK